MRNGKPQKELERLLRTLPSQLPDPDAKARDAFLATLPVEEKTQQALPMLHLGRRSPWMAVPAALMAVLLLAVGIGTYRLSRDRLPTVPEETVTTTVSATTAPEDGVVPSPTDEATDAAPAPTGTDAEDTPAEATTEAASGESEAAPAMSTTAVQTAATGRHALRTTAVEEGEETPSVRTIRTRRPAATTAQTDAPNGTATRATVHTTGQMTTATRATARTTTATRATARTTRATDGADAPITTAATWNNYGTTATTEVPFEDPEPIDPTTDVPLSTTTAFSTHVAAQDLRVTPVNRVSATQLLDDTTELPWEPGATATEDALQAMADRAALIVQDPRLIETFYIIPNDTPWTQFDVTVGTCIKGGIGNGSQISIVAPGGVMSLADYLAAAPYAEAEYADIPSDERQDVAIHMPGTAQLLPAGCWEGGCFIFLRRSLVVPGAYELLTGGNDSFWMSDTLPVTIR
ncbi:MAG: hypothetical protein IKI21_09855 [Oscillospiraceae bacterium]|nr:hypothetical protein [Oscillospiraceae bacterium]